jgi:hypothetical protein
MPDIYTPRPDIVTQVLKDAGFEAQVEATIIKERPREITYRFRGDGYYAEFYVHDIRELGPAAQLATKSPVDFASPGIGFVIGAALVALVLLRRLRKT